MVDVKTVETQNAQVEVEAATQEQVVEVEAHTNEQVEKTPQKNKPTDVLRDLSKLLSVNLFDDAEAVTKVTEYVETLRTEKTTLSEQLETAIKDKDNFTAKEQEYQTKIEALGLGFKADNLDEVLALAKVNMKEGQSISDGLNAVLKKYGGVFVRNNIGTQHNDLKGDTPDVARTEQEKYLAQSKNVQIYNKTKN